MGLVAIGFWGKLGQQLQILFSCHPERSEGSQAANNEILRYAQDDRYQVHLCFKPLL